MPTIVRQSPAPLTRDERQLLAAVNRHRRANAWIMGYDYSQPRPKHGGEAQHRGSGIAVDWLFSWEIDGKTGRSLRIRLLNRQGYTERIALEADVDSVQEAVDTLVVHGLVPQGLSSTYRAGLEAPRYTAPFRLTAEIIDRTYLDAEAPGWQLLDPRDEQTWHDITGIAECEKPECVISDIPGVTCVVLLSTAWAESGGAGHLESDKLVTVRIPAAVAE